MNISFFEEFPDENSITKLKELQFPTKLYIASKSLKDFLLLKDKIQKSYKQVNAVIYWPILALDEGYWLSALSKISAIKRIINELYETNEKVDILWDAEVPWQTKRLYYTQMPYIIKNRKIISRALQELNSKHKLTITAFPKYGLNKLFSELAYASFSRGQFHYMEMIYSSLLPKYSQEQYLRNRVAETKNRFESYSLALGLIGRGVEDNITPLISSYNLKRDLKIAESEGIEEVVLYRLGGLTKEYVTVINQFH